MNVLTPIYARVDTFVRGRVEATQGAMKERGSWGDYAAIIVLAALILAALATVVPNTFSTGLQQAINNIFNTKGGLFGGLFNGNGSTTT